MTSDRKRKRAVRAVQESTGQRYTQASRCVIPPEPRPGPRTFRLADLLNECATLPPATESHFEPGPEIFRSSVLGATVPYATVLELAGALAKEVHPAQLVLESLTPDEQAVVVCGERRIALDLNWSGVEELCRRAGCGTRPYCAPLVVCDEHLRQCDVHSLVSMARVCGYAVELEEDPERMEGLPESDLLVQAAVGIGAYTEVVQAWLDTCFFPLNEIDDMFWDEDRALAMRHSVERERLRLDRVARKEGMRLRREAATCKACDGVLHPGWDQVSHPLYCSRACTPLPPTVKPEPVEPPF
ncbi:hypothetical protein ACFVQ9_28070 [Streptomyces goshikiensis]|uniref:hypothetical protein n=1 Tax=Streptomyces goshikiensis TaxID=1942 RepID=UPI003686FF5B